MAFRQNQRPCLTGANVTLLAYANTKIEDLDTRLQTLSKAIAELSVDTISPQQIEQLYNHLTNWETISFDDKRKVVDGLISQIRASNDFLQNKEDLNKLKELYDKVENLNSEY